VVGLSRTACDELWRWWGVEARLIYPGVELSAFQNAAGERDEQPVIACGASPDDERKRIGLLAEAFDLVRRERPGARLLLMRPNDGALEQALARDGVEFYDPSPSAVAGVFARAWVTALTSRDEAFGLVVVESLATGTPVVAANEAGPAEILDREGIGSLFDQAGAPSVARALLEAIDLSRDPATAERCRARARDFTAERCAVEHEHLYEELLAR
jgi:phosphatidylinositol alpha-mannosyltransferase